MNNLMVFEGNNVEVFEWNGNVLFNPYHVGNCLELSSSRVRDYLSKMNNKQALKLKNSDVKDIEIRKLNNAGEKFLTQKGVLQIIHHAKNVSSTKKEKLLRQLGFKNLITLDTRIEIEFLDMLEESLRPFSIRGIRQHNVLGKRIDYYIPSLNIAIEYDEKGHDYYSYEAHEGRQKEIENELGCRFIRVTDSNSHSFNVGQVIKEIFNI